MSFNVSEFEFSIASEANSVFKLALRIVNFGIPSTCVMASKPPFQSKIRMG